MGTPSMFPNGTSIDVQPKALDTFSSKIMDLFTDANKVIGGSVSKMSAKAGMSGMSDSVAFLRHINITNEQAGLMFTDVSKGAMALSIGAKTIAANYVISDDAAQDQMSDVNAAFTAGPGQQTMSEAQAAAEAQGEQNVDDIEPEPLPEPTDYTPDDTSTPGDGGQTPLEEVTDHGEEAAEQGGDTDKGYEAPEGAPPGTVLPDGSVVPYETLAPGPDGYYHDAPVA